MKENNPYVQVQLRDKSGNVTGTNAEYFWCEDAWVDWDGFETKAGWADGDGYLVGGEGCDPVVLAPGTAFWFKDPANGVQMQLTLAGQVLNDGNKTLTPTMNKWNLICNPFPEGVLLNSDKIVWTGITSATVAAKASMKENNAYIQIQARDKNGLVTGTNNEYFYCADAWVDWDGFETKAGWADGDGYLVGGEGCDPVSIPVGAGFWFKDPKSSVTIQFVK